ncbi:LysR family transcriptional regulator [Azoarcus sp. L1K30]|uniref:LysR substrate-binding domain-containing protein n=1 Tax=Azoarcus sp. L1K30 TaxID=2820277 RepID=UPI001B81F2A0|nr:LysR substrate-binding domain-containing protein [Azoarcus sp. L1K30]MBR0567408.1 LysR family transcriptional regulator [Azoarcus sp. L1K30]
MKPDLQIDPALLPALATFECVARHANFSRAAAEMGFSPSALSQSLRALEKRLGVRLLARTTRRVSLTEEGALILDSVRRGLAELGGALSALGDVRGQPAGTVRIALSRIAYAELFSPHIVDFSARYPAIGLEFYLDDGLTDIVAGRFDIGVRLGSCIEADMVAVALSRPSRMRIVGTPDYFRRNPPPHTPEDLAAHDCVRFRFTTSGRIARWDLEHNGQRLEIEVNGRFVVNDFVAEIDLARRGLALAQVVESSAMDDIETGRLVTTLDEYAPTLGAAHLYFPGTTHMPARLRVFIDYFQAANSARKATN